MSFVVTEICCRDRTSVATKLCLLWQRCVCRIKTFAMTNICRKKHNFVKTGIIFVITRLLSPQKYACCYKKLLSWQNYVCCDKHNFVVTKHVFCHVKSFVITKTILAAASTNDVWEGAVPGWLVLVSVFVCLSVTEVIVDGWVMCVCVWHMSSNWAVVPGWLVLVSVFVCLSVNEVIVDGWVMGVCVWHMSSNCECWYCWCTQWVYTSASSSGDSFSKFSTCLVIFRVWIFVPPVLFCWEVFVS